MNAQARRPLKRNFLRKLKLSIQLKDMIGNAEKGKRILTSTIEPKQRRIGHRYTGTIPLSQNVYWVCPKFSNTFTKIQKKAEESSGKNAYYPFLGDENFEKVKKEIKRLERNYLLTNELSMLSPPP